MSCGHVAPVAVEEALVAVAPVAVEEALVSVAPVALPLHRTPSYPGLLRILPRL